MASCGYENGDQGARWGMAPTGSAGILAGLRERSQNAGKDAGAPSGAAEPNGLPVAKPGNRRKPMKTASLSVHRSRVRATNRKGLRASSRQPKAPLGRRRVELLRRSFAMIEPQAGIAGLVFYRNLFGLDPSLRPLFQSSIELQSRKLMESLSYTLAMLDNPEMLAPMLEAMGRRHVSYGTRPEHYDTLITALLQTFGEVLKSAFTREVSAAWREALCFVTETMKRGAAETEALRGG